MRNKKRIILIAIIMLAIGFASLSVSLIINGSIKIAGNAEEYDVYFSGAELEGIDVSNEVIKDKKTIVYESSKLVKLNEESELEYEVTNGSRQYDADVNVTCGIEEGNELVGRSEYLEVIQDKKNFYMEPGEVVSGKVKVKLIKTSVEEREITLKCELIADAVGRNTVGNAVAPVGDYAINGYFINEEGEVVSNAYLAVYSSEKHVVKTDMYGYFYVSGLERGIHEIYYLNNLNPEGMEKEEIETSQSGEVRVATNNKKNIVLSNKYEIVDTLVRNSIKEPNKTYEISLDANGGEVETTTKEVTENALYRELPTPTRVGYKFNGWYLGEKLIDENVYVTLGSTHTLKAKWEANKYTLILNANGGSIEESELTREIEYGSEIGELEEASREGYTFVGWYTDITSGEKVEATSKYLNARNTTLYARWKANKYTVSFNATNGSVTPGSKEVTFGENYGELPSPTRVGYTFKRWVYNGVEITSDAIVSNARDIELEAVYEIITYTIDYTLNNGTVSGNATSYTVEDEEISIKNPTRSGYDFTGWTGTGLSNKSTSVKIPKGSTGNRTYTANFQAKTYTITLNANGGVGTKASTSVTYDSTYGDLGTASKDNNEFLGWYTAASGGSKITSTSQVTRAENHTLYAQYQVVAAPTISGGTSTWVQSATISVTRAGSAASGVKHYEYYTTTSTTAPSASTQATGTTTGSVSITTNGTTYTYFRTVSNNNIKSVWTGYQRVYLDTTEPSITINTSIPTWITKGDSYAIVGSSSVGTYSGGSVTCTSNINGTVTNTSSLSTGNHTITCTATTGAKKSKTATKSLQVTYTAYSITNLVTNGSFENGMTGWWNYSSSGNSGTVAKYGSKSFYRPVSDTFANYAIQSISWTASHKYYYFMYAYTPSSTSQTLVSDINCADGNVHIRVSSTTGWVKVGTIYTSGATESRTISINYGSTSAETYIDGITIVDLTATFGSGKEPDKAWCDKHINYFDGTTTIYK